MASTTVINANATSKPQPSTAPPIEPLKNDAARLYTHIHPILVLSVYALKFPALVADPVPTLLSTLAPLAVLQIAFVAVCLPPTGGTPTMRNKKPGEKKGKAPGKLEQGLNSKIVVRILYNLYTPY
jgi:phosphatidylinositol glycan class F